MVRAVRDVTGHAVSHSAVSTDCDLTSSVYNALTPFCPSHPASCSPPIMAGAASSAADMSAWHWHIPPSPEPSHSNEPENTMRDGAPSSAAAAAAAAPSSRGMRIEDLDSIVYQVVPGDGQCWYHCVAKAFSTENDEWSVDAVHKKLRRAKDELPRPISIEEVMALGLTSDPKANAELVFQHSKLNTIGSKTNWGGSQEMHLLSRDEDGKLEFVTVNHHDKVDRVRYNIGKPPLRSGPPPDIEEIALHNITTSPKDEGIHWNLLGYKMKDGTTHFAWRPDSSETWADRDERERRLIAAVRASPDARAQMIKWGGERMLPVGPLIGLAAENPALHSAAIRLAQQEEARYPLLKVSRRLQRLQVQQDALLRWYLDHKDEFEWPCGPTDDNLQKNAEERRLFELRESDDGLIGVFAKQPVRHQTSLQYPGIIMTREQHERFQGEVYCPTAVVCTIENKKKKKTKYILYGLPCRFGPMINHPSPHLAATGQRHLLAQSSLPKSSDPIPSNIFSVVVSKELRENHELLFEYDLVDGEDYFVAAKKACRSCDMCALRTPSIPSAADFRDCGEEGCVFGRHLACFSDYDQEDAENNVRQFLCLDHEEQTFKRYYADALRMLQFYDKYKTPEEPARVVSFDAEAHMAKLDAQQKWLDKYADSRGYRMWSHVSPSKWVKRCFEIRPSGHVPGTLGVFATMDIDDVAFPGCILAMPGRTVPKEYRIPYNGLVLRNDLVDELDKMINCPTTVGLPVKTHSLIGNPADLGPMLNSVDMDGKTKLPDGKSGLPSNRKVNCEFGCPAEGEPGPMSVFVQIVDRIPKDGELIIDYGPKFWSEHNARNSQACEVCQLKFTEKSINVPLVFLEGVEKSWQTQTCAHDGCIRFVHIWCADSLPWFCSVHAPKEVIDLDSDEDEQKEQVPRQKAPTSAASAAVVEEEQGDRDDDDGLRPMDIEKEAGTGNRARLARLRLTTPRCK